MKKTIYFNGKIITVNENNDVAEAVLVEDGKISKVGTNEEVLQLKSDDVEVIDLDGKAMLPGFIDPHGHIVPVAQTLMLISVGDVNSIEELVGRLKDSLEKEPP